MGATARSLHYEVQVGQAIDRAEPADLNRIEPDAPLDQPKLFSDPTLTARVIPFDSLTSQAGRQEIRARAAELSRPSPLPTEKVRVRRARRTQPDPKSQRTLDLQIQQDLILTPQSHIICDAIVAPPALRAQASFIDLIVILIPCVVGGGLYAYIGGEFSLDKHTLPFLLMGLATVPFFYKFLWTIAGRDTIGMSRSGLRLVDFDGNPPSKAHRYHRFLGAFLSFLAAGIGLVWALVDEDGLTWHDHISGTFPTISE